jgi:hypothetical protein
MAVEHKARTAFERIGIKSLEAAAQSARPSGDYGSAGQQAGLRGVQRLP